MADLDLEDDVQFFATFPTQHTPPEEHTPTPPHVVRTQANAWRAPEPEEDENALPGPAGRLQDYQARGMRDITLADIYMFEPRVEGGGFPVKSGTYSSSAVPGALGSSPTPSSCSLTAVLYLCPRSPLDPSPRDARCP